MTTWPLPIQTLNDDLQVWRLWAVWDYQIGTLHASRWSFVTLRDVGTTQAELADMWRDILEPTFVMRRPNDWSLHHLAVEDQWPGVLAEYVYHYPPDYAPDSSGDGTPPQISPVLPWASGHPGRSYRGRTYWGPVREAHSRNGFLDTDGRLAPSLFGNAITFEFGPTQPIFVPAFAIISTQHNGTPTDPPQWTRPAFFGVDAWLRTQRRRQTEPQLLIGG